MSFSWDIGSKNTKTNTIYIYITVLSFKYNFELRPHIPINKPLRIYIIYIAPTSYEYIEPTTRGAPRVRLVHKPAAHQNNTREHRAPEHCFAYLTV